MSEETGKKPVRAKLFIMMALEFFIWGAWLPLIWGYMNGLGFSGTEQALIGSCFAIASVFAIFFSNEFADRTFSSERFMAVSHLVGGAAMLGLFFVQDFWMFFVLMLVHALFYVPTISVSNSLAFANLKNPRSEFAIIRMGGTIGWIAASWPLYFVLKGEGTELQDPRVYIFLVSAVASFVLAAFSLTLPHTPPKPMTNEAGKFAWMKAVKFLAVPYLAVLFLVTLIDSTIHNGYFLLADGFLLDAGIAQENTMPVMSIGQVAEILTMIGLGYILKKLGWKTTMIVGILGHAARFAVFAFFPENVTVLIAVQVLHGVCYAFFFATLYIFIDEAFPKDVRASAQGLFNLLILGIGDLLAKWIFLPLKDNLTSDGSVDYKTLFLVPTFMAFAAAVLLALFFRPKIGEPHESLPEEFPAEP